MAGKFLKRLASRLPIQYQQELKRLHFSRQIRRGSFISDEPEFDRLGEWVKPGDQVLDIGANIGHYTTRLSALVGPGGRVFSFEPVTRTFELLATNVARMDARNVTLLNVAVSDKAGFVGMSMPLFDTGLTNYYMAQISTTGAEISACALTADQLGLGNRVSLAKIDVEGHELAALRGMEAILRRDHPLLIVEGIADDVAGWLATLGYTFEHMAGSPNRIFRHN